jgi:hypothetical protein
MSYPLQTGANCVAYAYWVAINSQLPIEHKNPYTPASIEAITGAPAAATQLALNKLPGVSILQVIAGEPVPFTVLATWDQGFSHAVTYMGRGRIYDPALGQVVQLTHTKYAKAALVVVDPTKFPLKSPLLKFYPFLTLYRKLKQWQLL